MRLFGVFLFEILVLGCSEQIGEIRNNRYVVRATLVRGGATVSNSVTLTGYAVVNDELTNKTKLVCIYPSDTMVVKFLSTDIVIAKANGSPTYIINLAAPPDSCLLDYFLNYKLSFDTATNTNPVVRLPKGAYFVTINNVSKRPTCKALTIWQNQSHRPILHRRYIFLNAKELAAEAEADSVISMAVYWGNDTVDTIYAKIGELEFTEFRASTRLEDLLDQNN